MVGVRRGDWWLSLAGGRGSRGGPSRDDLRGGRLVGGVDKGGRGRGGGRVRSLLWGERVYCTGRLLLLEHSSEAAFSRSPPGLAWGGRFGGGWLTWQAFSRT